jgi:hypothetical protein
MPKQQTCFRLDEHDREYLQQIAEATGTTPSTALRHLITMSRFIVSPEMLSLGVYPDQTTVALRPIMQAWGIAPKR